MMNRFSPKLGAITLIAMGALYLAIALAAGHSAASEPPPNLRLEGASLDVWRAAGFLLEQPNACVVDVRSEEQFELFSLPRATRARANARAVEQACQEQRPILIVAKDDATAAELAGEIRRKLGSDAAVHFLAGGARAWYLALALPVPLFAAEPPPYGYAEALARLRSWLDQGAHPDDETVANTLGVLIRADYQPTALRSKKKPAATKKRKAISGGCG